MGNETFPTQARIGRVARVPYTPLFRGFFSQCCVLFDLCCASILVGFLANRLLIGSTPDWIRYSVVLICAVLGIPATFILWLLLWSRVGIVGASTVYYGPVLFGAAAYVLLSPLVPFVVAALVLITNVGIRVLGARQERGSKLLLDPQRCLQVLLDPNAAVREKSVAWFNFSTTNAKPLTEVLDALCSTSSNPKATRHELERILEEIERYSNSRDI